MSGSAEMQRTNRGWWLGSWMMTLASLLGAACDEQDDGAPAAAGEACAQGSARLRECGLLTEGTTLCNVTAEEREEVSCSQGCLARAECPTLAVLACSSQTPMTSDAASLNACLADCADRFGFHCTGVLGDETAIPLSFVCDGEDDCADGADELSCELFDCGNGESIVESWFCDGIPDCSNASDEGDGCEHASCTDGTQIPKSFLCDGADDCGDGSDEAGCGTALLQCL